jgi:hypothetical protein
VSLQWCDFALHQSASCPRSSWLLSIAGFRRNTILFSNQTLPPSDASFLDENDNNLDVKHHSATKLSLLCAGFLDEKDDLWDEYASCY